jgi:hypothetical protein
MILVEGVRQGPHRVRRFRLCDRFGQRPVLGTHDKEETCLPAVCWRRGPLLRHEPLRDQRPSARSRSYSLPFELYETRQKFKFPQDIRHLPVSRGWPPQFTVEFLAMFADQMCN